MTKVPNIAIAAAERRVRMLEMASRNEMNGVRSTNGTAHGRVVEGSNVNPDGRLLDAAPRIAARCAALDPRKSEAAP